MHGSAVDLEHCKTAKATLCASLLQVQQAVEALDPEHLCREYWAGKAAREAAAAGLPLQGQQQGTGPAQHPHQHLLQQQQAPQEGFWTYDQPVPRAQHDLQALGPAASESQQ